MALVESALRMLALQVRISLIVLRRRRRAITIQKPMIRRAAHRTRIGAARTRSGLDSRTLRRGPRRAAHGRVSAQRLVLWRRRQRLLHAERLLMAHGIRRVAHRLWVSRGHEVMEGMLRRIGRVVRGPICRHAARRRWCGLEVRRRRVVARVTLVLLRRRPGASALATGGGVARAGARALVVQWCGSSRNRRWHLLRSCLCFALATRSMLAAAAASMVARH